jgi:lysozyme family protein
MKTIIIALLLTLSTDLMNGSPYVPSRSVVVVRETSFFVAFNLVMINEGGWSNHKMDKGGLTFRGITYRWNKKWVGWRAPINSSLVKSHYYKIWKSEGFDKLHNQGVANYLFDTRISISRKKSIKMLNKCLGLNVKLTKQWINPLMDTLNVERLSKCRCNYYKMIVKKDSSQVVFLKGWLKRAKRI